MQQAVTELTQVRNGTAVSTTTRGVVPYSIHAQCCWQPNVQPKPLRNKGERLSHPVATPLQKAHQQGRGNAVTNCQLLFSQWPFPAQPPSWARANVQVTASKAVRGWLFAQFTTGLFFLPSFRWQLSAVWPFPSYTFCLLNTFYKACQQRQGRKWKSHSNELKVKREQGG